MGSDYGIALGPRPRAHAGHELGQAGYALFCSPRHRNSSNSDGMPMGASNSRCLFFLE